ncbi:MAG: DUF4446 family protein [Lachnospiraceae bacterium]|nr:DUF4446 family protein [Lachnospiraceae bacterium]
MKTETILGMNLSTVIYILLITVVLLIIFVFLIIHKMNIISRKYNALMSGKKGADLEQIIRVRFKEMDKVKANAKKVTREHKDIQSHLSSCFNKMGLVKYDAFNEMAGKLSFVLALLDQDNTGVVINAMHSREGCHIYAKEIIKGESYIPLSDEEKEALEKAKTVEEEIEELTKKAEPEEDISFDL